MTYVERVRDRGFVDRKKKKRGTVRNAGTLTAAFSATPVERERESARARARERASERERESERESLI